MKAQRIANDFPIVCVGGSAGGLDAYTRLLQRLRADMGVAIVIVNHLRVVATLLHEILPRYTRMPVELITERLLIRRDRVFIIPPQRDLHVLDGEFRLKAISKPRGWPDVITVFLRSLTRHWDGKLIAVIVSGYDGDGGRNAARHKRSGRHYHRAKARDSRAPGCARERHSQRMYRFCSFTRGYRSRNFANCALEYPADCQLVDNDRSRCISDRGVVGTKGR
jgi:two-component system chemotaxis response regulator CheB